MKVVRYAKLPIAFDVKMAQEQLKAASAKWKPHLNVLHYTGEWDVLPLRSPGGRHDNPVPDLIGEETYGNTIYMDAFPAVKTLLDTMCCPIMAARFLNLRAGAMIKEHRDHALELEQGEARLHFPIITNPEVEFYCEGERIFLNEGECWYLNANLPHRVSNNSDSDRIHFVVDCKVNDWLLNLIAASENIAYKKLPPDPNIFLAIKHLRSQNTEATNKLADEMEQRLALQSGDE